MRHSLLFFLVLIFMLVRCTSTPESTQKSESNSALQQAPSVKADTSEPSIASEKEPLDTTTSTEQTDLTNKKNTIEKNTPAPVAPKNANTTSREKKGNVVEFYQNFSITNDASEYVSEPLDLDLSNTASGMLSAYSLYTGDYHLYYRVLMNDTWSAWETLPENPEVNNPNRKAFTPKQLKSSVAKIQFKCDQQTDQEVVFRIFTFSKN